MRSGGISNKNLKNILLKMKEDFKIMNKFNLKPLRLYCLKTYQKLNNFLYNLQKVKVL